MPDEDRIWTRAFTRDFSSLQRSWRGRAAWCGVCVFSLILATGCAPLEALWPNKTRRDLGGVYHTVQRGENLWRIGRAYGVEVEQIAVLNGIADPDRLRAGSRIFILGARNLRRAQTSGDGDHQPPKRRVHWSAPPKPKSSDRTRHVKWRTRNKNRPKFSWPLRGRVVRRFGTRGGKKTDGILIATRERAKVRAAAEGRVIFSDFGPGRLGRLIILRHQEGEYHSVYARIAKNLVRKGQQVSRGTPIALAGRTRGFKRPHVHFEIRHRTQPQNPLSYLP